MDLLNGSCLLLLPLDTTWKDSQEWPPALCQLEEPWLVGLGVGCFLVLPGCYLNCIMAINNVCPN